VSAPKICEICDRREVADGEHFVYVARSLPGGGIYFCRECLAKRDELLGLVIR